MIKFYDIDENYVKYLQSIDKQIPNIHYSSNNKFVCGIVLSLNDVNYYAPVSHLTKKQRTNLLIYDDNKPISSIRFSFMLPAMNEVLKVKDFNKVKNTDLKYYDLLLKEYVYCIKNEKAIKAKALSVYEIGCNENHPLNYTCCDFKLLESKYKEYKL